MRITQNNVIVRKSKFRILLVKVKIYKMNIVIWLSVICVKMWVIESFVSVNNNRTDEIKPNQTNYEPNGVRLQRILKRKRRFLIFPPGSALVVNIKILCISMYLIDEYVLQAFFFAFPTYTRI